MRITDVNSVEADKIRKSQNIKPEKSFAFTLQSHIEENELEEQLKVMVNDINEQGKILSDHMDFKDFKKYKEMIKEFIEEVTSTSHKFSREEFLDRRGRHKIYGMIRLVNKDVDDIAQEMLKNEKNSMTILEKIDEIRGLLLDILT
ncbi:MAG: YaaR family protein [Clostridia bacterium]|nr:YaaR family protein [Clostridia bacterium]